MRKVGKGKVGKGWKEEKKEGVRLEGERWDRGKKRKG